MPKLPSQLELKVHFYPTSSMLGFCLGSIFIGHLHAVATTASPYVCLLWCVCVIHCFPEVMFCLYSNTISAPSSKWISNLEGI